MGEETRKKEKRMQVSSISLGKGIMNDRVIIRHMFELITAQHYNGE